ncbi:MAG TPA: hypothetical protein VGE21_03260 [Flavobacteriales bacterium]
MVSPIIEVDGVRYETTLVSDVGREGQGMEILDPRIPDTGIAIWFDDTTGAKTFTANCRDLPLEVIGRAMEIFDEYVVNAK